jgi:hypothetical protein
MAGSASVQLAGAFLLGGEVTMQSSIEDVAYTMGTTLVSPGVGSAELALGLLVALGFAVSALFSAVHGGARQQRH